MGEIVNLRRARKRLRKAEDAQDAAENRARFGRTRAEAAAEALASRSADARLDGARLDGARLDPADQTAANLAKDRDTIS